MIGMRVFGLIFAVTFFLSAPSSASAQWVYMVKENAFGSDTHIAMTGGHSGFFGFNCNDKGVRTMMYATNEAWKDGMQLLPLEILLKVDKGETQRFKAVAVEVEGKIRIDSEESEIVDVMKSIAAAKRRIDVAAELMGEAIYPQKLGVSGSTTTIGRLLRSCNLN